jgi:hypothetical protein
MILEQLQIAPEIVRIAFTAIMFALALGLALAFGLGGRELAADALRQARDKGSAASHRAKEDAQLGTERARNEYDQTAPASSSPTSGHADPAADPNATQRMSTYRPEGGTTGP